MRAHMFSAGYRIFASVSKARVIDVT